ncbi:hypothetical protein DAKH74_034290 [Maudiozyma humilis]|uniref:Uncharacterized protein n=1 Tax=Maudiozyma humilis TaxID=51915 RepID=A0AAV5RZT5_MAUHU|nr:hypothetical protein DAKH74_034290 [Kazachstania humilis]
MAIENILWSPTSANDALSKSPEYPMITSSSASSSSVIFPVCNDSDRLSYTSPLTTPVSSNIHPISNPLTGQEKNPQIVSIKVSSRAPAPITTPVPFSEISRIFPSARNNSDERAPNRVDGAVSGDSSNIPRSRNGNTFREPGVF